MTAETRLESYMNQVEALHLREITLKRELKRVREERENLNQEYNLIHQLKRERE